MSIKLIRKPTKEQIAAWKVAFQNQSQFQSISSFLIHVYGLDPNAWKRSGHLRSKFAGITAKKIEKEKKEHEDLMNNLPKKINHNLTKTISESERKFQFNIKTMTSTYMSTLGIINSALIDLNNDYIEQKIDYKAILYNAKNLQTVQNIMKEGLEVLKQFRFDKDGSIMIDDDGKINTLDTVDASTVKTVTLTVANSNINPVS